MKVSAKHVTRRKAQKSTGSTIAQNGTRSDVKSQRLLRKWEQKARTSKEWKWQRGSVEHSLSKANGTGSLQNEKVGVREA